MVKRETRGLESAVRDEGVLREGAPALFERRDRAASGLSRPSLVVSKTSAFTLIELIVVLAILALLLTIAAPRYFAHIERAKEATLKQDLAVMRDAIDKFHGDKGRYPDSLEEMVTLRYIRGVPLDPITDSLGTWKLLPPPDGESKGAVYDVRSGAEGKSLDGKLFADW